MKFEQPKCPSCKVLARGTLESVLAVANFNVPEEGEDNPDFEYYGDTDILWDDQETETDGHGRVTLMCPDCHGTWDSAVLEDIEIEAGCFGIVVSLVDRNSVNNRSGGGSIKSDLKEPDGPETESEDLEEIAAFNHRMDALESLILAHAIAGVDIRSVEYREGIETAVQACSN